MLRRRAADEGSTSAQLPAAQDRDPVSAGGVASFLAGEPVSGTLRDELRRLEAELAELEAVHDFEAAGESPEIEALIGRIAELSAELDAEEDQALEAMPPERRVVHTICETRPVPTQAELEAADARERALESKQRRLEAADARERALESKRRRREARLRGEWERWRYQRAKLPAGQRGPMLKIGERVCRYCGGVFVVDDLRRRFCPDTNCRQLHHKARVKASSSGAST